jgi:enoyl-CoA hydratase
MSTPNAEMRDTRYDKYKLLKFDRRGRILTITMDNPPLNAADVLLHDELSYVFDDVAADNDCDVIVLTGAGRAFSAGGDFNGLLRAIEDSALRLRMMSRAAPLVTSILGLDKPTIARVNGHAMGLGATLALLCDVVIAVESAKIADPHVSIGLSAGDGGALIWPHLVGYAKARHHLLTGEPLVASEAARIGLIHRAVPAEELDAAVDTYADRLVNGPTQAIRATKRSINMALCAQAVASADAHIGLELLTMSSADHREAIVAMMEKRAPVFIGR